MGFWYDIKDIFCGIWEFCVDAFKFLLCIGLLSLVCWVCVFGLWELWERSPKNSEKARMEAAFKKEQEQMKKVLDHTPKGFKLGALYYHNGYLEGIYIPENTTNTLSVIPAEREEND